jgi:hypothetical protein
VTGFLCQKSDSSAAAPSAALAGRVPTRCGHALDDDSRLAVAMT